MLVKAISAPLICIKAFCYSVRELITPTPSIALPSMQEAVKIQSEFFQDQMRSPTDYSKSMGDSALKAATGPLPQRTEVGCKVDRGAPWPFCRSYQAGEGDGASIPDRLHRQRHQHHDPRAGDGRCDRYCPHRGATIHRVAD